MAPPESRPRRHVRRRRAAFLVVPLVSLLSMTVASAATPLPKVRVTTMVTTIVSVYEFSTYFDPPAVNISCEIDHNVKQSGSPTINQAYCTSASKKLTHHVTVSSTGVVATCVGESCGSNAGLGTPTFYPGTEVRSGPFTCVISSRAVTCREHNARGFVITAAAIVKI